MLLITLLHQKNATKKINGDRFKAFSLVAINIWVGRFQIISTLHSAVYQCLHSFQGMARRLSVLQPPLGGKVGM